MEAGIHVIILMKAGIDVIVSMEADIGEFVVILMEAAIDAIVLMEAEMGRRRGGGGGQHWVPTARWPQAVVPLSATTCELDTRCCCLLTTREIFYCPPPLSLSHQLTSTADHRRPLPNQCLATRVHHSCNHWQKSPYIWISYQMTATAIVTNRQIKA